MNSKQRKTFAAVFSEPTPAGIEWTAIESLLLSVGCRLIEGNGSRVRFERDGLIAAFHCSHPTKEAKRYQVPDAREFLTKLRLRP